MSTNAPSPSKAFNPFKSLGAYRSPKSPKSGETRSREGPFLSHKSTETSYATADSASTRSDRSRGRNAFRDMVNRFRSSSNVARVDAPALREADFKLIDDWLSGFDRYNQLVTTRTSPTQAYASEEFTKISAILTKNCGGRLIHGLPEAVFDWALLWCPAEPLKRGQETEPSWSWTGWQGAINFPFDPSNCPDLRGISRDEGSWFKSEVKNYHIGPSASPYCIRREKQDRNLRTEYPPYFHVPTGYDASADSNTLRFSASTISANDFEAEQLQFEGKDIPCCQLKLKGTQCGVIVDFQESIAAPSSTGPFEFVLISRNQRCDPISRIRRGAVATIHPPGTPIWDGERFLWDKEVVECDEEKYPPGPWTMLNVMLIKWVGDYAERVAVARIHEDAWNKQNPIKKDIILM